MHATALRLRLLSSQRLVYHDSSNSYELLSLIKMVFDFIAMDSNLWD